MKDDNPDSIIPQENTSIQSLISRGKNLNSSYYVVSQTRRQPLSSCAWRQYSFRLLFSHLLLLLSRLLFVFQVIKNLQGKKVGCWQLIDRGSRSLQSSATFSSVLVFVVTVVIIRSLLCCKLQQAEILIIFASLACLAQQQNLQEKTRSSVRYYRVTPIRRIEELCTI